jgi:hypothetical protein
MKTLVIFELVPEETKLYLFEGDRRELNGHFINGEPVPQAIEAELGKIGEGEYKANEVQAPIKLDSETFVVVCGFYL